MTEFMSVVKLEIGGNNLVAKSKEEYMKLVKEQFMEDYGMNLMDEEITDIKEMTANPFSLYSSVDGWENATSKLEKLIEEFGVEYDKIKKEFCDVGIGDTETDGLIVDEIYNRIHS